MFLIRISTFALWLCLVAVLTPDTVHAEKSYVGAEACRGCHASQYEAWRGSDHFQSMLPATTDHVRGDFSDQRITLGGRTTRFFKAQGKYFIETPNEQGKATKYPVIYTFGYFPLQQYLLETEKGRLQAFDIAWDARPEAEGGQRWYQLQDEAVTDPEHPFFWTGYYQNWNSRCASCHSTNLQKNYDPSTQRFNTSYSDVNVACESCHGPGSEHLALAKAGVLEKQGSGLAALGEQIAFHFGADDAIARPETPATMSRTLDTCGGCHSRRGELNDTTAAKPYHDRFQLEGVEEPLYFSDGQIRDEVFVLGSFLQSKMAQAGVTCTHCHDPHSNQTILPGAQVCSTCHQASVFESDTHTNGHKEADCLDCHMPERIYMQVDARRDHRFHRPDNQHPNSSAPCRACHEDKSPQWLTQALTEWPRRNAASPDSLGDWARINHQLANQSVADVEAAVIGLKNQKWPALLNVALGFKLAGIAPAEAATSAQQLAQSDDPIARRGAAQIAMRLPEETQRKVLTELMDDPSAAVRAEVANAILALPPGVFDSKRTEALLSEYEAQLNQNLDHPGPNLGIAQLAVRRGQPIIAKQAFERAIDIAPAQVSARLSYAEFLRSMGNAKGATRQLERALAIAPDVASVQFAVGLSKIRDKAYQQAIPHLARAAQAEDATPHFAFVYAVALWQTGKRDEAIDALKLSTSRWPEHYDMLVTLAKYAYQQQDSVTFLKVMDKLKQRYPEDATVRQMERLSQGN